MDSKNSVALIDSDDSVVKVSLADKNITSCEVLPFHRALKENVFVFKRLYINFEHPHSEGVHVLIGFDKWS